jgi:hypothetical protein
MGFELAGPVEFSGTDLAWLLFAASLALFGLPLIGAAITYVYYRRPARRDVAGLSPAGRAGIAFVVVFVAQLVVTAFLDWLYGVVPGSGSDALEVVGFIFLVIGGAALYAAIPFLAGAVTYAHYRRRVGSAPNGPSPIGRAVLAFVAAWLALPLVVNLLQWLS